MRAPARLAAVLLLLMSTLLIAAGMAVGLVGLLAPELVWRQLPADVLRVEAVGGGLVAGGVAGLVIGLAHGVAGYRSWEGPADGVSAMTAVAAGAIGIALLGSAIAALVAFARTANPIWSPAALGLAAAGVADLLAAVLLAVARARIRGGDESGAGI